ncbi:MAG: M20/M25/M40 family metallo-hydrolase [Bacteroidales bacterium]
MLKKLSFLFLILLSVVNSQLNAQAIDPFIQEKVDQLSYDTLYSRLQTFENLGIKQVGTQSLENTANWIIDLYEQFGYTDIETDTFSVGANDVYNIIVSRTGTLYPDTWIIIDAHYDTYFGPGVNDNGSGTAIVLEMARMLKEMESAYSIKFIHFTAEELGLLGSYHYVENTVLPQNMDIRLVFNIDEVGGVAGEVNNTITCERDEWAPPGNNSASAAFTDTLANVTEPYSDLLTNISYAYGSDYVPFMNEGYVVTGFYEYNESPYPHSINDSLSNMDPVYVFEITKASLAAAIYFTGAQEIISNDPDLLNEINKVIIYPNPFCDFLNIENKTGKPIQLSIYNSYSQLVNTLFIKENSINKLTISQTPGVYYYQVVDHFGMITKSGKLLKQ